ncbi:hypothetical protein LCGC14_0416100 [marine sediment metagenome]|uniref:Large polyvalent protein associated domain-containing protein n=1 Tax=marine sediment metagenome TaxID=412755 RepID=A0A0F9SYH2_9ZZZZ
MATLRLLDKNGIPKGPSLRLIGPADNDEKIEAESESFVSRLFADSPTDLKAGFKDITKSYKRSGQNIDLDIAAYDAAFIQGDMNKLKSIMQQRSAMREEAREDPLDGGLIMETIAKNAGTLKSVLRGLQEGSLEGMVGMLAGAGLGSLAGGAGAAPGAVAGLGFGFKVGMTDFWYKQGAGNMMMNMMEAGNDPEIAKTVASIAAMPYALIEMLQVGQATPGLRKGAQKIVQKSILKVLGMAAKKFGGTLTSEVLEEVAQEGIQIAAEDVASYMSDQGVEFDKEAFLQRFTRLGDTFKESVQSMVLLPAPGAVIDVSRGGMGVQEYNKRVGVVVDRVTSTTSLTEEQARKVVDKAVKKKEKNPDVRLDKEIALAVDQAERSNVTVNGVEGIADKKAEETRPEGEEAATPEEKQQAVVDQVSKEDLNTQLQPEEKDLMDAADAEDLATPTRVTEVEVEKPPEAEAVTGEVIPSGKGAVFQSTQSVGGKKVTQSAIHLPAVIPADTSGTPESLLDVWKTKTSGAVRFLNYDTTSKETGLDVGVIASQLKAIQQRNPNAVSFSTDRMGKNVAFKVKDEALFLAQPPQGKAVDGQQAVDFATNLIIDGEERGMFTSSKVISPDGKILFAAEGEGARVAAEVWAAEPAANGQKARAAILSKQLGMDGKAKSDLAKKVTGKGSTTQMNKAEVSSFISELVLAINSKKPVAGQRVKIKGVERPLTVRSVDKKGNVRTTNDKRFNADRVSSLNSTELATDDLNIALDKIATGQLETLIDGVDRGRSLKQLVEQGLSWYRDGLLLPENIFASLGPEFTKTFWDPMNQADAAAGVDGNIQIEDLIAFMNKEIGTRDLKRMMTEPATLLAEEQQLQKEQQLGVTPGDRIGIWMLSQNPNGLRHLIGGNFAKFADPEAAVNEAIGLMTEQEKKIGQFMMDKYKAQGERLAQSYFLAAGRDMKIEKNYFPLYSLSGQLEEATDFLTQFTEDTVGQKNQVPVLTTPQEVMERTEGAAQPVRINAFDVFMYNMPRVERYIHFAPTVSKLGKIFNDKGFKKNLNDKTHGRGVGLVKDWIRHTAMGFAPTVDNKSMASSIDRLMLGLRKNGIVYAIGWKIPSVARQTLSMSNAVSVDPAMMSMVPKNIALASFGKDGGYKTMEEFVFSRSDQMRNRSFDRDLRRIKKSSKDKILRNKVFDEKALGWVSWMDRHTTTIAWKSLYDSAKSGVYINGVKTRLNETEALAYADEWTRKTQPSANAKDLPAFFRGGTVAKTLTTFQNQVNKNGNFWWVNVLGEAKNKKIGIGLMSHRIAFSYIIPAMAYGFIGRGGPPEDWGDVAFDLATYPLGSLFVAGRVVDSAIRGYGGLSSIAGISFDEFGKAAQSRNIPGVVKHGIRAIGAATGRIPDAPIDFVEGSIDLYKGDTEDWRRLIYSEWALESKNNAGKGRRTRTTGRRRKR